jgi:excisionase family DNA binding protein
LKRTLPIRRSVDALTKAAGFKPQGRPLTARAVADLCGVELKTVHNWVLEGRIEHFRTPGRHLRFPRAAVHAFLLACGYEASESSHVSRGAVVVKGGGGPALHAVLRRFQVSEVDDLPSALIVVARSEPALLIIDLTPRWALPEAATLRALARLLPGLTVVLFGKPRQRSAQPLHGALMIDGVDNMHTLLQSLISR